MYHPDAKQLLIPGNTFISLIQLAHLMHLQHVLLVNCTHTHYSKTWNSIVSFFILASSHWKHDFFRITPQLLRLLLKSFLKEITLVYERLGFKIIFPNSIFSLTLFAGEKFFSRKLPLNVFGRKMLGYNRTILTGWIKKVTMFCSVCFSKNKRFVSTKQNFSTRSSEFECANTQSENNMRKCCKDRDEEKFVGNLVTVKFLLLWCVFFLIFETTDVLFMTSWMPFEMGRKFTCGKKTYISRYEWRIEGNLLLLCNQFSNDYGKGWCENPAALYVAYIIFMRNEWQD